MLVDWTECGKVLSGRALDKGESVSVFLIDEQTERLWETDRLQRFTPAPDRLGQWSWPIDFCLYINRTSDVIQAGSWKDGKWVVEGSSFSNRLWRTAQNIRAFTNCPGADNWIRAEPIHPTVSLKAGDVVEVMVRSEISGRRYRAERFRPLKDRLQPAQWAQDLAAWINKTFDMIRAGCPDASGQRIKETADKAGNYIWVPHNSRLTVSWEISEKKQAAQVLSGRDALEGERICAYLVDDLSGERLQSEDLVFKPAADRRAVRDWVEDFCKEINKRAKNMRAGYYDDKGVLNVAHSFERNFIWTWRKGLRAFTTAPHLNNWVQGPSLLTDRVMTVDERVIVRVCNKANGAVWETLLFTPKADRLKPALWVRDLSTLINQQSLFVRAGQPNPDTQVIETIADVYRSHIWVPKHSELEVKWDRVVPQSRGAVTSDRDAVEGESISLFVMDEATGEILERPTYKAVKDSLGQYLWPRRFASEVNRSSRYVQVGDKDENGVFTTFASGYKNRIWTPDQHIRAFSTSLDLDNWVMARPFSFERDLKAGDRMVVHVRSELTGYLYQTLTFSPVLKNNRATAADWTRALCEKLNKECVYLKAGCKNEKTRRIEPVADHDRNAIWVPVGSGLAVEVLNIGDKTRYAAPIEVHTGVDPAKGRLHIKIPFGALLASDGQGPKLDIGLVWTTETGWDLYGFSHMILGAPVMGGESVLFTSPSGDFECFKRQNMDNLNFQSFILRGHSVLHKNGMVEVLNYKKILAENWYRATASLPSVVTDALGNSFFFKWRELPDNAVTKPMFSFLAEVKSGKGILFSSEVAGTQIKCVMYPGTAHEVIFDISVESDVDDRFTRVDSISGDNFWRMMKMYSPTFPFGRILNIRRRSAAGVAFLDLHYDDGSTGFANIERVASAGRIDRIEYQGENVSCLSQESTDGRKVIRHYAYGTNKTTVNTSGNGAPTSTELRFDSQGLVLKQIETREQCVTTTDHVRTEDAANRTVSLETTITRKHGNDSITEKKLMVHDAEGNLIKRVEKGTTTEYTYYRGEFQITEIKSTQRVSRISSVVHGIGAVLDYANPVGWFLQLFSQHGLTWGTEEITRIVAMPYDTKHPKTVYNLPVELECPGDRVGFKVYLESEKVYRNENGARKEVSWTFYSYSLLPERNGCENAIKASKKLIVLSPSVVGDKLSGFTADSMSVELTTYDTNTKSSNFGRVIEQNVYRLSETGEEVTGSRKDTFYTHACNDFIQTTTVEERYARSLTKKLQVTSNVLTGCQTSTIDEANRQKTWSHDQHGRLSQEVEDAQGSKTRQETHFTVHGSHRGHYVTARQTRSVQPLRREYDLGGNEVKVWTQGAGFVGWRLLTHLTRDGAGKVIVKVEHDYCPDGTLHCTQAYGYQYDGWGDVTSVRLPGGATQHRRRELAQRRTLEYLEFEGSVERKLSTTVDEYGRRVHSELQDRAGQPQSWVDYSWSADDLLIKVKEGNDPSTRQYEYDPRGRMTKASYGDIETRQHYPVHSDLADKVAVGKPGEASVVLGRRVIDPLSRVAQTEIGGRKVDYRYQQASQLGERTTAFPAIDAPHGQHATRHTVTSDPRSGTVREQVAVTGSGYTNAQVYSLRGRLLSFDNGLGLTTRYHYDPAGRLVSTTSPRVHNQFTYDGSGSLTHENVWDVSARTSVSIDYTYDILGREVQRIFTLGKKQLTIRNAYQNDRIVSVQLLEDTTAVRKEKYAYTPLGQLDSYACEGTQLPTDPWLKQTLKSQTLTYDTLGNIATSTSVSTSGRKNVATYLYNAADRTRLEGITHSDDKACPPVALAYDSEGRLTRNSIANIGLVYNDAGRQVGVKAGKDSSTSYYDPYGRRTLSGFPYYYDLFYYRGDRVYARHGRDKVGDRTRDRHTVLLNESEACLLQESTFDYGSHGKNTTLTFELKDMQGTVVATCVSGEEKLDYLCYTPYGYRPSTPDDSSLQGFTGQVLDHHCGGVYHLGNGFRAYNPQLQCFQSPDTASLSPFGQAGINNRLYCLGDPRNMVDPGGHLGVVIGERRELTHAPFLDDPIVNKIFTGALMIAAAPFLGGGALMIGASIGLSVVSTAFGVGAVLARDNPDLAAALSWLEFGASTTELVSGPAFAAKAPLRGMARSSAATSSNVARQANQTLRTYVVNAAPDAFFRITINMPTVAKRANLFNKAVLRTTSGQGEMVEDLVDGSIAWVLSHKWGDSEVEKTVTAAGFPGDPSTLELLHLHNVTTAQKWFRNQGKHLFVGFEDASCRSIRPEINLRVGLIDLP